MCSSAFRGQWQRASLQDQLLARVGGLLILGKDVRNSVVITHDQIYSFDVTLGTE